MRLAETDDARQAAQSQVAAAREESRQAIAALQGEALAAQVRARKEADAEIGAAHAEGIAAASRARAEAESAIAEVRATAASALARTRQEADSSAALMRWALEAGTEHDLTYTNMFVVTLHLATSVNSWSADLGVPLQAGSASIPRACTAGG